jgi:large subunit ribosomal protein L29
MKQSQIKELTLTEIKDLIQEETVSLSKLRFNHSVSPLENPVKLREIRRNIARLKTALKSKSNQGIEASNKQ